MVEPDNVVLQHLSAIREQLDTLNNRVLNSRSAWEAWKCRLPTFRFVLTASMLVLIALKHDLV